MTRNLALASLLLASAACSSDDNTSSDVAPSTPLPPAGGPQDQQPPGNDNPAMQPPGQPNTGDPSTGAPQPNPGDTPPTNMDGTAGGGSMTPEQPQPTDMTGGDGPITEDCQGLDFSNLVYSPGGNVLPNSCAPFHPTTNNPYAVRCIDAWPWYETRFPGDEMCILPPAPDQGVQFGAHPQGLSWFDEVSQGDMSGYDDPQGEWIMQPGQETERNYYTSTQNPASRFYRNYERMRAGSHHMIVSAGTGGTAETWGAGSPLGLFAGTRLPGAQRVDQNTPITLDKPAEDAGLYIEFPANPTITINVHHFNSTGESILRESWTNIWWEEDARVPVRAVVGLPPSTLAMNVPAGATQDLHYVYAITQETRLLSLFGHRHAWTPNFSAWVVSGGQTEIIYQSFDWFDQPSYRYDSLVENPVPAPDLRSDGALSGVQMLQPGDELHFNCHITFTQERAAAEGAPSPQEIGTLRFANQAFNAEMCILFGETAGVSLPAVFDAPGPLPDFATLE